VKLLPENLISSAGRPKIPKPALKNAALYSPSLSVMVNAIFILSLPNTSGPSQVPTGESCGVCGWAEAMLQTSNKLPISNVLIGFIMDVDGNSPPMHYASKELISLCTNKPDLMYLGITLVVFIKAGMAQIFELEPLVQSNITFKFSLIAGKN
jgi:hypothetical protein